MGTFLKTGVIIITYDVSVAGCSTVSDLSSSAHKYITYTKWTHCYRTQKDILYCVT